MVVTVFDAVLLFPAVSVTTHAATDQVTSHCPLGVTTHLYTVLLTAVNVAVPFARVKSPVITPLTGSLNVPVMMNVDPLKYVPALLVNVTVGGAVSIHVQVTSVLPVLPSLSFIWIVHVSVPTCHAFGV